MALCNELDWQTKRSKLVRNSTQTQQVSQQRSHSTLADVTLIFVTELENEDEPRIGLIFFLS